MVTENPIIGITLRVEKISAYNETRDALSHDWNLVFNELNAIPIFIPNNLKNLYSFLEKFDFNFLILSGGDNIGDSQERDLTEKIIIDYSIKHRIPVIGICRGMQVLNNYFGGTLEKSTNQNHVSKHHLIHLTKSLFSQEFKSNSIEVNSFHNNILKNENLGRDLEPFAICEDDGTIEGFFHKSNFVLGVMWHPEREMKLENVKILTKILTHKKIWDHS